MSKRPLVTLALLLGLLACNITAAPQAQIITATPQLPAASMSCESVMDAALAQVGALCGALARNQLCYGSRTLTASFRDGSAADFSAPGTLADLDALQGVRASPLDLAAGTWGIAVLSAQANIPDTVPGQAVTFVLFGDAEINGLSPNMQAVVLSTGIGRPSCAAAPPNAVLIQSDTQVTMTLNGASLTLGSTVLVTAVANAEMQVVTIEGTVAVGAFGAARVVQPGTQVRLPLGGVNGLEVVGAPTQPEAFDAADAARTPLRLLPRAVTLPPAPSGLATPGRRPSDGRTATPTPTRAPSTDAACTPRADWTDSYAIQSGDTLSRIAGRYNLTVRELQDGNCISDPNLIRIGQVLAVPPQRPTDTPAPPTFSADASQIPPRQCTTVRWAVASTGAVYFEDQPVQAQGFQQVCPSQTTTYTLLVVYPDGAQMPYTLTIEVLTPAVCGNQRCEAGETANTCPNDCLNVTATP